MFSVPYPSQAPKIQSVSIAEQRSWWRKQSIESSLTYIADWRHLLTKALNAIEFSRNQGAAIALAHRNLLAPLHAHLVAMGIIETHQAMALVQAITDVATKRIESISKILDVADAEIVQTSTFTIARLRSLVS